MATQFSSATTGEWVATRWFAGSDRGCRVDYGANAARRNQVAAAAQAGESFVDEYGNTYSGEEFSRDVVEAHAATFGEFGGTFRVGSGDAATYEGF